MGRRNAFWYYMQDQKRRRPEWRGKCAAELQQLCDPGWAALSPQQRRNYEKERAEGGAAAGPAAMSKGGSGKPGKFAATQESLSAIARRDKAEREMAEFKEEYVDKMIDIAEKHGTLNSKTFILVHANIFVKTEDTKPITVPAEIAVLKFSIQDGLSEDFQAFIEPGTIPVGYKRLCFERAERGHKIPVYLDMEQPGADGSSGLEYTDPDTVLAQLERLMGSADCRALFTMPDHIEQAGDVLAVLASRAGKIAAPAPLLLSLPTLLARLHRPIQQARPLSSLTLTHLAEAELERQRFQFVPLQKCCWHEERETEDCSRAWVRRWAFSVLDICCGLHGVIPVSGKHLPTRLPSQTGIEDWQSEPEPVLENSTRASRAARAAGPFASEDIRYREVATSYDQRVEQLQADLLSQLDISSDSSSFDEPIEEIPSSASVAAGQSKVQQLLAKMKAKDDGGGCREEVRSNGSDGCREAAAKSVETDGVSKEVRRKSRIVANFSANSSFSTSSQ